MKARQNLYLELELSKQLDKLAKKPGVTKSSIVAEALKAQFERRDRDAYEESLKPRLDRLSKQLGRIERDQRVLVETVALYIRFHFSVLPPLPAADQAAAKALAQERFQAFIDSVGRRVAGGRSTADDIFLRAGETRQ
jgi:predicted DNA-binding protein